MPSEKQLRDDIAEKLGREGYVCWWPGRQKFKKAQDIFTLWDMMAAKGNEVRYIQFTTKSNKSSHVKKINDYRALYDVWHTGEIWSWDGKEWQILII